MPGPLPVVPEAIRIVPASTAAASNSSSSRVLAATVRSACAVPSSAVDARQQRVERDLLQHEAAVVAAVVDVLQVPLAEVIIGPLAGRMVEVVGPRVERQLVEQLADRTRPAAEFPDRSAARIASARVDQLLVRPAGDADVVDVERNRPHALVGVRLDLPRFEHGDGPIADVVVERLERAGDDPLGFVPRPALRQNGLERPAQEQRPPQLGVRLMPQQVAMKLRDRRAADASQQRRRRRGPG